MTWDYFYNTFFPAFVAVGVSFLGFMAALIIVALFSMWVERG